MTQSLAHPAVDSLFTYYDDATGERTALTAGELGKWAAATAALLTDGCGLGPGRQAGVLLPPHWQTAAVLLGAWAAGLQVSFRGWSTAGLAPAGDPLDVTFVDRRRVDSWLDEVPSGRHRYVLGLAPGAAPTPQGYQDYVHAVRPYLGAASPDTPLDLRGRATVDGTTFGQYGGLAVDIARSRGVGPGDRVLVDAAASEEPLIWLAPLFAGASVVLCANLDRAGLDERIAAERVTRTL
ncbi:TIGR03089 family protein [Solwaraspora sp. WMMD1047]|uniref:TIGR03089 family protein n=1 Tax=Solwaraspora sp. WMMD1047 TaxID=3016102 RepID=UPI00241724F6|nr:TIGR03089 family protein [Solwaraspora sp. WMMD1047]MDG4829557.1 TIGR03089 family protein [Solwaraspora sp. WMMD1047]